MLAFKLSFSQSATKGAVVVGYFCANTVPETIVGIEFSIAESGLLKDRQRFVYLRVGVEFIRYFSRLLIDFNVDLNTS
jgi:hypothetical protein